MRNELGSYNSLLLAKTEYIFLSKKDAVPSDVIGKVVGEFKKLDKNITPISIFDWDSIELVKKILNNLISEKMAKS